MLNTQAEEEEQLKELNRQKRKKPLDVYIQCPFHTSFIYLHLMNK